MLWNCILLRDEITPIDRSVCRESSLSLLPCHPVYSVACPVFTFHFLFQFVLCFLCLVINFSFLEHFLFCPPLSWSLCYLVLSALLFHFSTYFSACPHFGLFTISYFPPIISYHIFLCSSLCLLIPFTFVSFFFIFHSPFLFSFPQSLLRSLILTTFTLLVFLFRILGALVLILHIMGYCICGGGEWKWKWKRLFLTRKILLLNLHNVGVHSSCLA